MYPPITLEIAWMCVGLRPPKATQSIPIWLCLENPAIFKCVAFHHHSADSKLAPIPSFGGFLKWEYPAQIIQVIRLIRP